MSIETITNEIWVYPKRYLRSSSNLITPSTDLQLISDAVWNYSTRTLSPTLVGGRLQRKRGLTQRPEDFIIDQSNTLAKGLVFAGLGRAKGSTRFHDSSAYGNHGTLTSMDPATDWVFDPYLGRWVLDCDGTNDYIITPLLAPVTGTVFCWIKRNNIAYQWEDVVFGTSRSVAYSDFTVSVSGIGKWNVRDAGSTVDINGAGAAVGTTWHSVALTLSVGGNLNLFVDGVSVGSNGQEATEFTGNLWFGNGYGVPGDPTWAYTFPGLISDGMAWNRVLSVPEIQTLANPADPMLGGLIQHPRRRTFRAAVPTPSPAAPKAIVYKGFRGLKRYKSNQRPEDFVINNSSSLARGLVFAGLGRAKGSKHFHDSSFYGSHGTLTNMDPATDWVFDQYLGRWVLDFDGSDDYVDTNVVLPLGSSFTLSGWVYPKNWVNAYCGFGQRKNQAGEHHEIYLSFWKSATGNVYFYVDDSINCAYATGSAVARWVHVAGVCSGTSQSLYVNGVLVDTNTDTPVTCDVSFRLGPIAYSNGYLFGACQESDVLVHNRALSLPEIQTLANPADRMLGDLIQHPRRRTFLSATLESVSSRRYNIFINGRYNGLRRRVLLY